MTQSIEAVHDRVRRGVLGLVGIGGFALLVGLGVAWLLANSLSKPLRSLAGTARRVEGGDLEARAEQIGPTEQREVATAFNDMTDRLGTRARRAAGVRRQRLAPAAHAAHRAAPPARGRRAKSGPDAGPELEAAEREVERLARLLSSLLTLAREGDRPGPSRPVSLARAAERAQERWTASAEHEGRTLELVGDGDATIAASEEDLAHPARQPDRERAALLAVSRRGRLGPRRLGGLARRPRRRPRAGARRGDAAVRALHRGVAPGTRAAAQGSAWRSWTPSPGAGAGELRSPIGRTVGPARRFDSRRRLPLRRRHGSKPRRSRARARRPPLCSGDRCRRLRRLARLGRGARDPPAAESADTHPGSGAHETPAEADDDCCNHHDWSGGHDRRRPRRGNRGSGNSGHGGGGGGDD